MEEEHEEWRKVVGFSDYSVSNLGRVRRDTGVTAGKVLRPWKARGYNMVDLYINGDCKKKSIHRLVAQMFIENPQSLPEVNHKDGRKGNNSKRNLEWVTTLENMCHAAETGLMATGDRHGTHTLPESIPRGDNHYSRKRPDLLSRGDSHYSRTSPEKLARGERNGSRKHPELLSRGEKHGMSRLDKNKVILAREMFNSGGSFQEIADSFGVNRTTAERAIKRKTWKHVV